MPSDARADDLEGLVDHLFRRESGRLVARLVRVIGPRNIDLAEEAVQDAMIQALKTWPHCCCFRGVGWQRAKTHLGRSCC